MMEIKRTARFKKDYKKVTRAGNKNIEAFISVVDSLKNRKELDAKHRDHYLSGNWNGYKECHVAPDWLLIYRIKGSCLELVRTGSHSELFE